MTDDQHRIGQQTKAQILIADALERHTADPRDPQQIASWVLEQLQNYGWRPPLDLTDTPPLRPANATKNGPGYAEFQREREALAARRRRPDGHHPGEPHNLPTPTPAHTTTADTPT